MTFRGRYDANDVRARVLGGLWADADPFAMVTVLPDTWNYVGTGSSASLIHGTNQFSFTAVTQFLLYGIFESFCDNYVINMSVRTSTAADIYYQYYSVATGWVSTSTYTTQFLTANSTTVTGSRTTTTAGYISYGDGTSTQTLCQATVYSPYLAQPTAMRAVNAVPLSGAYLADAASIQSGSTSFDSIGIGPVSGTMTGTISVYGLKG